MMRCKALFFFFLLSSSIAAQNLVPNGSFEDYISCPEYLDGMEFVEHWYKSIIEPGVDYYLNPSPDYYNECALNPIVGVPDNVIGNQMAHEGAAYSGLYTYEESSPDYREVMGVSLNSALIPGQTYYCSMYYVRAVGWSMVGLATNNLCMKFSNEEIFSSSEQAVNGVAHIKLDELAIDSVNWGLLYGEFTPQLSYQYLHIGNFFSSNETEIESFSEDSGIGYYFIDHVRVSTEPFLVTSDYTHELIRDLDVFPNPVNEILNIAANQIVKNVRIVDVSGKLIEEFAVQSKGRFSLNVENISKGLYIAHISFDNGECQSVRVIKN